MTTTLIINESEFEVQIPERPAFRMVWDEHMNEWVPSVIRNEDSKEA